MQGCRNLSGAGGAIRGWLLCLLAACGGFPVEPVASAQMTGEMVLADFTRGFDRSKVEAQGATFSDNKSTSGTALRVCAGKNESWPGVRLPAPGGHWDLSPFAHVVISLANPGTNELRVSCRVDNPGADGSDHCVTGSLAVGPGKAAMLRVPLKRSGEGKLNGKLFGMRGYPSAPGGPGTVNASNVSRVLVFLTKPQVGETFDILDVRAGGSYTRPTASVNDADPFFPLIDTFGQYRHRDWPGKVHSVAELTQRAEQEKSALLPVAANWDDYGGWADGPVLKDTGFFRVEKYHGKWWLIDPLGRLFWSHGIDCVRSMDLTPIEERESWFEDFPGDTVEGKDFIVEHARPLKGYYAGHSPKAFSFASANLRRKYGPQWREVYPEVIHRRLHSWGLNTIGNWSDDKTRLMRRTPYTDAISSGRTAMIEGSEGYWGKFPDPFASSFKESLRRSMAGKKGTSGGDPWCLGYFSDNEMSWGDDTSLAIAALRSPPEQPAKKALIAELKRRYGEIGKLNASWGTKHLSWEALLTHREAPDKQRAREDLAAFYTKIAEQYFQSVRDTIKEVAPNQLYLGCRFAWGNARAAAAAAKYCDVVSYNLYRRSVADFEFNGGADVPLMIGEFHFGALDRGLFHTGLVPVASQAERAAAYTEYVQGALRHSQFVGCHWFQYMDQPTTGRAHDEENYQIGFVDTADTPYAETIAASREVARNLYTWRLEAH
jgi:hypothetical protein